MTTKMPIGNLRGKSLRSVPTQDLQRFMNHFEDRPECEEEVREAKREMPRREIRASERKEA